LPLTRRLRRRRASHRLRLCQRRLQRGGGIRALAQHGALLLHLRLARLRLAHRLLHLAQKVQALALHLIRLSTRIRSLLAGQPQRL
jgi:hypothetical protein